MANKPCTICERSTKQTDQEKTDEDTSLIDSTLNALLQDDEDNDENKQPESFIVQQPAKPATTTNKSLYDFILDYDDD